MMNNKIYLLPFICLLSVLPSCRPNRSEADLGAKKDSSATVCLAPSDINPNGASELARLMRIMEAQTETWKKEIEEGRAELSAMPDIYHTLKTAVPTTSEMKNENFNAFSDDFVNYSSALVKAPKAERKTAFNSMVGGCMACHDQMCPGPIKRIRKFYF